MSEQLDSTESGDVAAEIGRLITRARAAQAVLETYSQERVDDVVAAAAWAIYEPERALAMRRPIDAATSSELMPDLSEASISDISDPPAMTSTVCEPQNAGS